MRTLADLGDFIGRLAASIRVMSESIETLANEPDEVQRQKVAKDMQWIRQRIDEVTPPTKDVE